MALTDNGNALSAADVAAVMGGNGGYGNFGKDGMFWLLILFLFAWTGNGWGGFGNCGNGPASVENDVQRGFDQQAIMTGIGALNTAAANAEVSRSNMMSGITQSINDIAMGLQNCCCENRAATADLKYTMATEGSATRETIQQGVQGIIANQTANNQAILDKLCALELDGVKGQLAQAQRENVSLQNQLNMATFAASQVDQTAQLRASQATTANQLVAELRSCPIPAQPVYGNQPIFTCPQTVNSCGCGNNGF